MRIIIISFHFKLNIDFKKILEKLYVLINIRLRKDQIFFSLNFLKVKL